MEEELEETSLRHRSTASRHHHHQRRRAKKAPPPSTTNYDDVFGGPPRHAVPFSGVPDDYSEVFGGVSVSCSIPFLDLPMGQMDSWDCASGESVNGVDYGEIFGRCDFADFAVPYEELFGRGRTDDAEMDMHFASANGRSSAKSRSGPQTIDPSAFIQEYSNDDTIPYLDDTNFSVASDELPMEYNTSYSKSSRTRSKELLHTTASVPQPQTGFTFVVEPNKPLPDHIPLVNEDTTTDENSANPNMHSTLNIQTISNKEPEQPGVPFLDAADVNLLTRSANLPPPSRPPPSKSLRNEKHNISTIPKTDSASNFSTEAEQPLLPQQGKPKSFLKSDSLPPNFDFVPNLKLDKREKPKLKPRPNTFSKSESLPPGFGSELDAMKEAMEFAQARLKTAKELHEKRREGKITELPLKKKNVKEEILEDSELEKPRILRSISLASNFSKSRDFMKVQCGVVATQGTHELEKSGKWRSDEEFHELSSIELTKERESKVGTVTEPMLERNKESVQINGLQLTEVGLTRNFNADVNATENLERTGEIQFGENVKSKDKTTLASLEILTGSQDPVIENVPVIIQNNFELETDILDKDSETLKEHANGILNLEDIVDTGEVEVEMEDSNRCTVKVPEDGDRIRLDEEMKRQNKKEELEKVRQREKELKEEKERERSHILEEEKERSLQLENEEERAHKLEKEKEKKMQMEKDMEEKEREQERIMAEEEKLERERMKKWEEESERERSQKEKEDKQRMLEDNREKERKLEEERREEKMREKEMVRKFEEEKERERQLAEVEKERERVRNLEEERERERERVRKLEEEKERDREMALRSEKEKERKRKLEAEIEKDRERIRKLEEERERDREKVRKLEEERELEKERVRKLEEERELDRDIVRKLEEERIERERERMERQKIEKETEQREMERIAKEREQKEMEKKLEEEREKQRVEKEKEEREKYRRMEKEREEKEMAMRLEAEKRRSERRRAEEREKLTKLQGEKAKERKTEPKKSDEEREHEKWMKEKERKPEGRKSDEEREKARERKSDEERERDRGRRARKEREIEEREKEREKEEEEDRKREREKDRLAMERATQERAERIAIERITAARQRAVENREKEELNTRGGGEGFEKKRPKGEEEKKERDGERNAREARLRAERAAVERATAEARERAIEKAKADAEKERERLDRLKSFNRISSQDNAQESHFKRTHSDSALSQGHGESSLRHKARLERQQRTAERAAKALAEKNRRDIMAQREQAERDRFAEHLDADVRRWSSGKEGDLRALLSTLQYILGHNGGWQPIHLTEVITAADVKRAYRKATLYVHPDKLQQRGASIQQKYICEKVFDLLKEAWNKFNSEER